MKHFLSITAVAIILCCASSTTPTTNSKTITLRATAAATVGDLLQSANPDRPGFCIPDSPLFRQHPTISVEKPSTLYSTKCGNLPVECILRFINNGHILFARSSQRKAYKKAMYEALHAHNNYKAAHENNTTFEQSAYNKLVEAEVKVFVLLKQLPLTLEIILQLEDILSIPIKENLFKQFLKKTVLFLTAPLRHMGTAACMGWAMIGFFCSFILMMATDSPHNPYNHLIATVLFPTTALSMLYFGALACLGYIATCIAFVKREISIHSSEKKDLPLTLEEETWHNFEQMLSTTPPPRIINVIINAQPVLIQS